MSSEDDYYVELYERHAEARKGRRARRRGSGGTGSRHGNRGLIDYRGHTKRRPRGWLLQSSMRIAGLIFIVLIAIYELYLLRQPRSSLGENEQEGGDGDIAAKLSEVGADAEGSFAGLSSQRKDEGDDSENAGAPLGASQDDAAPAIPPPAPEAPPPVPETQVATIPPSSKPLAAPLAPQVPRPPPAESSSQISDDSLATEAADTPKVPKMPGYSPREVKKSEEAHAPTKRRDKRKSSRKSGKKTGWSSEKSATDGQDGQESGGSKELDVDEVGADSSASETSSLKTPKDKESAKASKSERQQAKKKARKVSSSGNDDVADAPKRKSSASSERGAEPGSKENFWKWFQESKETEGTGASSVECPKENHKLCQMFYKYVRKYKIRAIYDVSCGKNLGWIGITLRKVSNELWGFKYHCGETDPERMGAAKEALKEFSFVEFDDRKWWKAGFPEDIELLFAWDTLAHTAFGRVWSFFVNVRKQDIKWVLVDNYPSLTNDPSPKREFINLRKHPFRFPAATAVVQDVREVGEAETVKRQLLLYEGSALPDNLG
jgi:hypothetical protein